MTREEAAQLVAMAVAAYPFAQGKEMGPTAEVWRQTLGDLPYPAVKAALLRHIASSPHWPTVAEIRQAALELLPQHAGLPSPEEAWEEVRRQVRLVGYYGTPKWSHPAVGRAAEALYGSWRDLCLNLTAESAAADRAHFLRLYESFTRRERENAALPPAVRDLARQLADRMTPALPGGSRRDQGA